MQRSVMRVELLSFSDMIDASFMLRMEMKHITSRSGTNLQLLTDSKTLSNLVLECIETSGKVLVIDVACVWE